MTTLVTTSPRGGAFLARSSISASTSAATTITGTASMLGAAVPISSHVSTTTTSSNNSSRPSHSLKRRSSPSQWGKEEESMDCHTLQSSMKRVRLSCSPGELRLDLGALTNLGWQLWTNSPNAETPPPSQHSSIDQDPRWFWASSSSSNTCHHPQDLQAELHLLDPLGLVLHLRRASVPQEVGRIWIQIPRMYPHRSPAVSRTENLWMETVIIGEVPPSGKVVSSSTDATSETLQPLHNEDPSSSTTLEYNEWSPVPSLGDLLQFLLKTSMGPSNACRRESPASTITTSSLSSSNTFGKPVTSQGASFLSGNSLSFFMEEHKMEDVQQQQGFCTSISNENLNFLNRQSNDHNHHNKFTSPFAPNRFDTGYEKYHDPLEHHQHHRSHHSTTAGSLGAGLATGQATSFSQIAAWGYCYCCCCRIERQ